MWHSFLCSTTPGQQVAAKRRCSPPNGPFIVIWKRVSLYVASPRSLEQGWQRSLGGLHKCIMNNWVGEARDCRWHSKAVICLDVSDCFYSLMGALPIKAQFTASHEVARIHPFLPKAPPPLQFSTEVTFGWREPKSDHVSPLCYWIPTTPHLPWSD